MAARGAFKRYPVLSIGDAWKKPKVAPEEIGQLLGDHGPRGHSSFSRSPRYR